MFAIAFDLDVHDTALNHPKSLIQAYKDIRNVLKQHSFVWKQGSVYTCDNEDLANLFATMVALKALSWFPASVRDIRAFRVEQWSDFTTFIKS